MNWRKYLFSPHGRIGRKSFWLWIALYAITISLAAAIDTFMLDALEGEGPASAFVSLAAIYPWVCVQAKRLHDLGCTGWLQVAPYVASIFTLPLAFSGKLATGELELLVLVAPFAVMFAWLGVFWGRPGPNRYGEPNSGDRDVPPSVEVFS